MSPLALEMEQHSRGLNIAQFVLKNLSIVNPDYGRVASLLSPVALGTAWEVSAKDSGLLHRKIALPQMMCPVFGGQKLDVELKDEAENSFKRGAIVAMKYRNYLNNNGFSTHQSSRRVGIGQCAGAGATALTASTIPMYFSSSATDLQQEAFDASMSALYARDVLANNLGVDVTMAQLANESSPLVNYVIGSMTNTASYGAFDRALGIYGVSR